MGSKRFDHVEDCLRNRADIKITCRACGHVVIVRPGKLLMTLHALKRRPPNWNFDQVALKLKCGKCGARRPEVKPTAQTR